MAHISVVTPVYQAEGCLEELYRRLAAALAGITQDFEIIMVEDCGGDRSWDIIQTLAHRDARVKGNQPQLRPALRHHCRPRPLRRRLGGGDGLRPAGSPGRHPAALRQGREGYEVVIARRGKRNDPLLKRLSSWMFYRLLSWLADTEYDSQAGNFRIVSRKVVENFRRMREQLRFFGGLVNWMGFPAATVDVKHAKRHEGRSTYTLAKLWRLAETMIAYSDKPLRLSIRLGFLIAFLAFCYGIYILLHAAFYGSAITGWASVIVSIYFIGGIIIAILGMLGIYLGKSYDETKKRPLYIVMHTTFRDGRKSD